MMKRFLILSLLPLIVACTSNVTATDEEQTDANTPLHLLRPDYDTPYVVPQADSVKAVMDRILNYVDTTTFMQLDESGKQLKRGTFRLTSYEWGVTYSAMLRAGEVTGDDAYTRYATDRMTYLAKLAPQFSERLRQGLLFLARLFKPRLLLRRQLPIERVEFRHKLVCTLRAFLDDLVVELYRLRLHRYHLGRSVGSGSLADDLLDEGVPHARQGVEIVEHGAERVRRGKYAYAAGGRERNAGHEALVAYQLDKVAGRGLHGRGRARVLGLAQGIVSFVRPRQDEIPFSQHLKRRRVFVFVCFMLCAEVFRAP